MSEHARQHVTHSGSLKKGWRVKKHAVLVAEVMRDVGKHVEVYRCSVCNQWHVGRQRRVTQGATSGRHFLGGGG